jgi:hypothetical protein
LREVDTPSRLRENRVSCGRRIPVDSFATIADAGVKETRGRALFIAADFGDLPRGPANSARCRLPYRPSGLALIDSSGSFAGLTLAWPAVPRVATGHREAGLL